MMITTGPGVDRVRYDAVWNRAVEDVSNMLCSPAVLADPDGNASLLRYRDYLNVVIDIPQWFLGAARTVALIREVCENRGYKVFFAPMAPEDPGYREGFVSWLMVGFEERELLITFNLDRMRRAARSTFQQDKTLAKVFLHECGHAALHLNVLDERAMPENPFPALDPDHEQEAWLYALIVSGILAGDHARASREFRLPDRGWIVA